MKNNERLKQKLFNLNKQLELEQKRNKSRWYALNSVILNTEFLVEKLKKKNNNIKHRFILKSPKADFKSKVVKKFKRNQK